MRAARHTSALRATSGCDAPICVRVRFAVLPPLTLELLVRLAPYVLTRGAQPFASRLWRAVAACNVDVGMREFGHVLVLK